MEVLEVWGKSQKSPNSFKGLQVEPTVTNRWVYMYQHVMSDGKFVTVQPSWIA